MDAKQTAVVSTNLPVNAGELWALFKSYNNWGTWFPAYVKQEIVSEVKEGVGVIRRDTTIRGPVFEEQLDALDNDKMFLKYHLVSVTPALPIVESSISTVEIKPIDDRTCHITWGSLTKLVEGTDPSKLEAIVAGQIATYTKGIKAATFHLIFHKHYEAGFSLLNARMMDILKALLVGQGQTWQYGTYDLPLPKMVQGLPSSEALPPMKFGQMIGRLMEVAYLQINNLLLHKDEPLPEGADPFQLAALQIASTYGNDVTQHITKYLSQHWEDDVEFCQQYLQGANPIQIQVVHSLDAVPENMRHLKAQGKDIKELIHEKRLFIADYDLLDGLKRHEPLYFYAPTVLFYNEHLESGDTRLNIVGIRLERTPNAPVYTPDMPHKNRFKLAKMFVACADNQVHQFALHLGIAHLGMEPICIAVHNALPATHPIHELLKPHLQETIGINFLARQTLIASVGAFTNETFAIGTAQGVEIASKFYTKNYDFYGFSFPNQLKSRGFDREGTDGLRHYLFREDGYKLWDVIGNHTTEYVNHHYADDSAIKNDASLQAWAKEMHAPEKAAVPGFKSELNSREELAEALQIIIWNGSAFHSFLNFPQWPYVGNIPNRPNAMYAPMPAEDGQDIAPEYIQKALAPLFGTLFQLTFTWALSLPSNTTLMDLGEQQKEKGEVGKKFYESLVKLTHHLKERNEKLSKEGKAPYLFLIPENVAASVDI